MRLEAIHQVGPVTTEDACFVEGGIVQAQVDQVGRDELLVRLVPDRAAFQDCYLDALREGLVERVGASMRVRFTLVDRIDPESGGKIRYVKRSWETPPATSEGEAGL